MTSPNSAALSRRSYKLLTASAMFAAMITLTTAYLFHIPVGVNGGYIHFGDAFIYLAAGLLPMPYACAAAAIGGGLADFVSGVPLVTLWGGVVQSGGSAVVFLLAAFALDRLNVKEQLGLYRGNE